MNFSNYLKTRYTSACEMQRAIASDLNMVTMFQAGGNPDVVIVRQWMQSYGLFQGICHEDRVKIVNSFVEFAKNHQRFISEPTNTQIKVVYIQLFNSLYAAVPRSWASATSKLLWCLYPNTIVIYDAFVLRTLSVMQCLDDSLAEFPRIGAPPVIGSENEIQIMADHYMNYQSMVQKLLAEYKQALGDLRIEHKETYPYDIRIMDKLLWMIGNLRRSY